MMRRLLVVAVILFMAPAAYALTASLSFTGNLPGPGGIDLTVTGATYDPVLAMVIQPPGVLSNFRANEDYRILILPDPGGGQPIIIDGYSGEMWAFFDAAPSEPYPDGVWLTADWSSTIPVWVRAYETLDMGATWILLDEIQVPEPMTVALLGLGGLFLLRHRRHK